MGVIDSKGDFKRKVLVNMPDPIPAFVHDYFVTEHYFVMVDVSLRSDATKLPSGSLFNFNDKFNVRFGIMLKGETKDNSIT